MSFSGELEAIAAKIKLLGESMPEIAKRAAEALRGNLQTEFSRRVGPNEKRWKPLAAHTKKYQRTTNRMRDGSEVRAVGIDIEMTSPSPAEFHQSGTKRMPKRPIFPTGDELPKMYQTALDTTAAEVVAKYESKAER